MTRGSSRWPTRTTDGSGTDTSSKIGLSPSRLFLLKPPTEGNMSQGRCWSCSQDTDIADYGMILKDGSALCFRQMCRGCAEKLRNYFLQRLYGIEEALKN